MEVKSAVVEDEGDPVVIVATARADIGDVMLGKARKGEHPVTLRRTSVVVSEEVPVVAIPPRVKKRGIGRLDDNV